MVFTRLCKRGVRLQGRRYRADANEEVRPGAYCPGCIATAPRCALCEESHTEAEHRGPVEGCRVGRGHLCPYRAAKCKNCGGPYLSQANACPEKRRVRQGSKGWRLPPPPRGQRKAPQPGQVTTSEVAEGSEVMLEGEAVAALLQVELGQEEIEG